MRRHSGKLITRPGKAAVKRVKLRLAAEMRALRGGNAAAVLAKINPIARGSPRDLSLSRDVAQ